jgi:hypothetical protein
MQAPFTEKEFLDRIAHETARMSYPGSMSRGSRPIVLKGTKAELEKFFVARFPLSEVWHQSAALSRDYDTWHEQQSRNIAIAIKHHVPGYHNPVAVSAKFLNTFMHQLMKYDSCRALWEQLHLPLDRRVFSALASIGSPSLAEVQPRFSESPYSLNYQNYRDIQNSLWKFVKELNAWPGVGMHMSSRIQLNWLWV